MTAHQLMELLRRGREGGRPNVYVNIQGLGLIKADPDEIHMMMHSLISDTWIDCFLDDEKDLVINGVQDYV